jgi:hypothetical protein
MGIAGRMLRSFEFFLFFLTGSHTGIFPLECEILHSTKIDNLFLEKEDEKTSWGRAVPSSGQVWTNLARFTW